MCRVLRCSCLSVAPVRERGLKYWLNLNSKQWFQVAPVRERGLKFFTKILVYTNTKRRSREGAWIEIFASLSALSSAMSLPRGSVD